MEKFFAESRCERDCPFSKGDILICDVRVETRERPGGLHAEFFIERVIEHRKPAQQPSLFGQISNRPT